MGNTQFGTQIPSLADFLSPNKLARKFCWKINGETQSLFPTTDVVLVLFDYLM